MHSDAERIVILVDDQNQFHALKARDRFINYPLLAKYLAGPERKVLAVHTFIGQNSDDSRYIDYLRNIGVTVHAKIRTLVNGIRKSNCDMEMAIESFRIATKNKKVDTIILVTGDGDFCAAIDYIKEINKRIKVEAASYGNTAGILIEAVSKFHDLGEKIDSLTEVYLPKDAVKLST